VLKLNQSNSTHLITEAAPTIRDVWEARKRIAPIVRKTPLVKSPVLSEITGASIYLKMENLHKTGSFKIRGAANKILSLSSEEQKRGVTTFSTGNHGMAVAFVARSLGIQAVICISNRVPKAKVDAIRRFGAKLEIIGDSQDGAEEHAYMLEKEQGLTVIKPFDDFHIIAGQGTLGLEIIEELPEINMVLAGLSGGGLISGLGMSLKSNDPDIEVIGLSMENSAVMHESLKAGKPIQLAESETLADSLLGGIGLENKYTFGMVQRFMDRSYLIPEDAIAEGMAYLSTNHRMIVEGAAVVGVGALLRKIVKPKSHTVLIVTGCNTNLTSHLKAIQPFIES
jgi:threonine dehydratase